jgi:hypothetical protein
MILIDFSNIFVSNAVMAIENYGQPSEEVIRSMILHSVRKLNKKFRKDYHQLVLAIDSDEYWRDDIYDYYKYKRRQDKQLRKANTDIDWDLIHKHKNKVLDEIRATFPYIVIDVKGCEGDDIIGALTLKYRDKEKIMIVSEDKDFKQLHGINVQQYSSIRDIDIKCPDPDIYLSEHIIRGDSGDGIPNILSPSDTFFTGTRQKACGPVKIRDWLGKDPKEFCETDEQMRRYLENQMLVDLSKIPHGIVKNIDEVYKKGTPCNNATIKPYLELHNLNRLVNLHDDFITQESKQTTTKLI